MLESTAQESCSTSSYDSFSSLRALETAKVSRLRRKSSRSPPTRRNRVRSRVTTFWEHRNACHGDAILMDHSPFLVFVLVSMLIVLRLTSACVRPLSCCCCSRYSSCSFPRRHRLPFHNYLQYPTEVSAASTRCRSRQRIANRAGMLFQDAEVSHRGSEICTAMVTVSMSCETSLARHLLLSVSVDSPSPHSICQSRKETVHPVYFQIPRRCTAP